MPVTILFDCGAFSYWNRWSKKAGSSKTGAGRDVRRARLDDFTYTTTPEYLAYREDYARFLLENGGDIDTYPCLDVVGNPELTYRNQVFLEDRGLRPWPVWHFGSPTSYLKRYLDEGYGELCIGGMPGTHESVLRPSLDQIWSRFLVNDRGMPRVKVHGFGMTMVRLMRRYPWFSVDSSSWKDYGRRGRLILPKFVGSEGLSFRDPWVLYVTDRRKKDDPHLSRLPRTTRARVCSYLSSLQVTEGDVVGTYRARDEVNLHYYLELQELFPRWPWPLPEYVRKGLLA